MANFPLICLCFGFDHGSLLDPGASPTSGDFPSSSCPFPPAWCFRHKLDGHGLHEGKCTLVQYSVVIDHGRLSGCADDVHWEPDGGPGSGGERAPQKNCSQSAQSSGDKIYTN